MDAERLVFASRHALAQSRVAPEIVAEAWQAQALAQAIGARLAVYGPLELRVDARGLVETGARGVAALECPGVRSGGIRAAQLSGMADARGALLGLVALLGDVGMALVGVACATDEDGLYWQCVEAMDAADESSDRVRAMLRKLAARDAGKPPDASRARAGPPAAPAPSAGQRSVPPAPRAPRVPGPPEPPGVPGPVTSVPAGRAMPRTPQVPEIPDRAEAVDSAAGRAGSAW